MLDIENGLLLMVALFNISLSFFLLRGNWRKPTNLFFGFFALSLAFWALVLIGYYSVGPVPAILYGKLAYAAALAIGGTFYLFSYTFPENMWPRKEVTAGVFIVVAGFVGALIMPGFLLQHIVLTAAGKQAFLGAPEWIVFTFIFVFFYLGAFLRMGRKYLDASGITKTQLLTICVSTAITGIGGIYYNLVLASPFVNDFRYLWTGPLFSTSLGVMIMYSVFYLGFLDAKVIATEFFVGLLWIFTFLETILSITRRQILLNGALFSISFVIGLLLVRSVRREVEQREHIEKLAQELSETNKRQEILFHFMSHEVKGFLTKDEGAFAALADGDFGQLQDGLKDFVNQALAQTRQGVRSVTDILKASNQKKGTTEYKKEVFDLKALTSEAVENAKHLAAEKGLTFTFSAGDSPNYQMTGDKAEIGDHVLRNLIENAINYTPSGSVGVLLKKEGNRYIIAVKDTGIGITEEDKKRLFTEGGHGKDSQKVNVHSTGYGLFIAKNIAEAHGGTIRAESGGQGKGSTFVVEFPA